MVPHSWPSGFITISMIDDDWYMFLFAQEKGIFSLAKVSKKGMWIGFQYWPLSPQLQVFWPVFLWCCDADSTRIRILVYFTCKLSVSGGSS